MKESKLIQSLIEARISLADRIINMDNMIYRYQNGMLAQEEMDLNLKEIKQYLRQQKRELNVLIDSINNAIRAERLKLKQQHLRAEPEQP